MSLSASTNEKKFKIFSTMEIPSKCLPILDKYLDLDFEMNGSVITERNDLLKKVKDCNAIICTPYNKIDKEVLDSAGSNLKVLFNQFLSNFYNFD